MVDTDVYSYITASDPRRGLPYREYLNGRTITLSFVTVAEQYAGYTKQILRGNWDIARIARDLASSPEHLKPWANHGNGSLP